MNKKYPKLSEFLESVKDKTNRINPVYLRNFRGLIKIIPFVGGLIDANTLGALQDSVLEKRLSELEEMCRNILKIDDAKRLVEKITEINSVFLTIIAQYQERLFRDNREIRDFLTKFLVVPRDLQGNFNPNPSFRLVVISGTSATGKDILLELLYDEYFPKHPRCDLLTKFTTRKKRYTDSRYYKFLTRKQFHNYVKSGRIIFYYTKRGEEYGFDKFHLFNALKTNTLLFCIFTEFGILPDVKQFLKEQGINVVFILLEAPEKHLMNRSWFRALPEEEVRRRLHSIKQDTAYINANRKDIEDTFDYIVYNGDDQAKLDTYEQLKSIISKY